MSRTENENAIAEQIVSVLPAQVAREFCLERGSIRYAVRGEGIKLRTIVLKRSSLRRLAADPAAAVKIEYLQRDLLSAATQRAEFRYPRPVVHASAATPMFPMPLALSGS